MEQLNDEMNQGGPAVLVALLFGVIVGMLFMYFGEMKTMRRQLSEYQNQLNEKLNPGAEKEKTTQAQEDLKCNEAVSDNLIL